MCCGPPCALCAHCLPLIFPLFLKEDIKYKACPYYDDMLDLFKALESLEGRNLKLNLSQDSIELLELRINGKNIDVEIKDREEFKKLFKEFKKWKS